MTIFKQKELPTLLLATLGVENLWTDLLYRYKKGDHGFLSDRAVSVENSWIDALQRILREGRSR